MFSHPFVHRFLLWMWIDDFRNMSHLLRQHLKRDSTNKTNKSLSSSNWFEQTIFNTKTAKPIAWERFVFSRNQWDLITPNLETYPYSAECVGELWMCCLFWQVSIGASAHADIILRGAGSRRRFFWQISAEVTRNWWFSMGIFPKCTYNANHRNWEDPHTKVHFGK